MTSQRRRVAPPTPSDRTILRDFAEVVQSNMTDLFAAIQQMEQRMLAVEAWIQEHS